MKKILLLLAALALVLCGCGENQPDTTSGSGTTTAPTQASEIPGLYDPESELEALTGGAVKCYPLADESCYAAVPMGENMLLFGGYDITTLTLLTGENLTMHRSTILRCGVYPGDPAVQINESGMGYYYAADRAMVFLDELLQENSRISLPEDATGHPALSPDLSTIYYCAGNQVRALDIHTGISRLIRELNCTELTITDIYCDGTVLCCRTGDGSGGYTSLYLSTQTGQTLWSGGSIGRLETWGGRYFAQVNAGSSTELVFSLTGEQEIALNPRIYGSVIDPVLAMGGSVSAALSESGCTLDYYDLTSGLRTACVELPALDSSPDLTADPFRNVLWFLLYDSESGSKNLCCWDPARSSVSDETVYTGKRYTAASPDTQGLALLEAEADRIGAAYGVQILLWKDAMSIAPQDYSYTAEHLVEPYGQCLKQLEAALAGFPEGFLAETAKNTPSGAIQIALVRSIEGDPDDGTLRSVGAVQYWRGGEACIGLELNDRMEQNAYHALFHVIETRVYASAVTYDSWSNLNPKGFSYDFDYIANQNRDGGKYLESGSRAFIDTYSMSFPREDRARIFEYAMLDDTAGYFTSDTMQKKLKTLCTGIRKAYGLQKSPDSFPWEQYLTESLAYTK